MSETIPTSLQIAFERYEQALMADDLSVLDDSFAPGAQTMRGDSSGLLVGHDRISSFRGRRGGVPSRTIERLEYRPLGPKTALLMSVSRYALGGTGLQTQVWQKIGNRWVITAAHVTPRPQPINGSIWRIVGDPLLASTRTGPLTGLTVAVKDLFSITGHRVGAGNPAYLAEARTQTATAPAVAVLLDGGADLRGIARTDEFAYSIAGDNPHYGTAPNAALAGALPGGSSSGPATAVALGQSDIGLATDTAGSVRIPASYQGIWGLRTTHGIISRKGMLPLAPSFDTVGWLTRNGETLQGVTEWCVQAMLSADERKAQQQELPWRFLIPDEIVAAVEPATRVAFEAFVENLRRIDDAPEIRRVSIGDLGEFQSAFRTVQASEAWRCDGAWVEAHPDALGTAVASRFRFAASVTAAETTAARAVVRRLRKQMRRVVSLGTLLFPTAPGPAPMRTLGGEAIDAVRSTTLRMTTPAAVGGLPAVSAPLLTVTSPDGPAPVGVCLTAGADTDIAIVRQARRVAQLVPQQSSV